MFNLFRRRREPAIRQEALGDGTSPAADRPATASGTSTAAVAVSIPADANGEADAVVTDSGDAIVAAPGPVRPGFQPAMTRARNLAGGLDNSRPIDLHVGMLADALQAGLDCETMLTLGEVLAGYHELCADARLVPQPWNRVSEGVSKRLGMDKRYRMLTDDHGERRKTRVFFVPARSAAQAPHSTVVPIRRAA